MSSLNAISFRLTMPSSLMSSGSGIFGNVPLAFFSIFSSCFSFGNGKPSGKRVTGQDAAVKLVGAVETRDTRPKRARPAEEEKRIVMDPRRNERT